jgi:tetratricopeptide (TPR) repeat protein
VKQACAALLLAALAGCAAAPRLQADPPGVNPPPSPAPPGATDVPLDPNIAKASAGADADAGTTEAPNGPQTPYQQALLNYKSGNYAAARVLIEDADQSNPGNVPIEMLKVRILTELHDFAGAHHVISSLYNRPDLNPSYVAALQLTSADLNLRERKFDAASKAYEQYLSAQPNDTDAKLRYIYARIGAADLVTAGRITSELKPLDAATPAYYFAHAALARAGVGTDDEDQDIQQARTIYGITLTNRYLKTYLEVFSDKGSVNRALNPPAGSTNAAPSGKAL